MILTAVVAESVVVVRGIASSSESGGCGGAKEKGGRFDGGSLLQKDSLEATIEAAIDTAIEVALEAAIDAAIEAALEAAIDAAIEAATAKLQWQSFGGKAVTAMLRFGPKCKHAEPGQWYGRVQECAEPGSPG